MNDIQTNDQFDDDEYNLVDAEQLNVNRNKVKRNPVNNNNNENADLLSQSSVSQDSIGGEMESKSQLPKLVDTSGHELQQASRVSRFESGLRNQLIHLHDTINYSNIRTVRLHKSKRYLYPMQADSFAKFEAAVFDVLGFKNEPFKLPEINTNNNASYANDVKKLQVLTSNPLCKSQLLNDMSILKDNIELNPFNQIQLKKQIVDETHRNEDEKLLTGTTPMESPELLSNLVLKPKVATFIFNQPTRPRKAMRMVLSKRNTVNLDSILSELTYLFKLETPLKRIYHLNGDQLVDPQELLFNESVFLVANNDKLQSKDLELEIDEIKLVYANELMKVNSNLNPELLHEKHITLKKMSALYRKTTALQEQMMQKTQTKNELDDLPEDLLENYQVGEIIGRGHFAVVHECSDINTGIRFALKIIDLRKLVGKDEMIENELTILRKVKHANVVKLVEEFRTKDFVYLVFELCKGGDLLETVTKRSKFSEKDVVPMVYSLASALSYLHSSSIVHRDVKLENILIQEYSDGRKTLKLGDFGLAAIYTEPLDQKCGSVVYVAPEILNGQPYSFEVDVWSLGIISYILFCGYAPFQGHNDDETMKAIQNNELVFSKQDWADVSSDAMELIARMLDRNQTTRIKASEILEDKWFVNYRNSRQKQEEAEAVQDDSTARSKENEEGIRKTREESTREDREDKVHPLSSRYKSKQKYKEANVLTPRYAEATTASEQE